MGLLLETGLADIEKAGGWVLLCTDGFASHHEKLGGEGGPGRKDAVHKTRVPELDPRSILSWLCALVRCPPLQVGVSTAHLRGGTSNLYKKCF